MSKEISENIKAPVRHWQSLEQLRQDPEQIKQVENEFLSTPPKFESESLWHRRQFLKLMGASMALSSAACLERPAQKIIPYVKRPKDVIPGIANYYTSTFIDGSEAMGIVVKTREGRPIKIEGNTEHPMNQGGTTVRAQAHILSLYDPDRLKAPQIAGKASTWEEVDKQMAAKLAEGDVAVLTSSLASPSTQKLLQEFCSVFSAKHIVWDALAADSVIEGQRQSYGKAVLPRYRFDRSKYTLSIGADFLGTYLSPAQFTKQFSRSRKLDGEMSKLVVFESMLSLTGANADERIRIKPSQQLDVVMGLLQQLIVVKGQSSFAGDAAIKAVLETFAGSNAVETAKLAEIADELWQHRGQSLIIAGGIETRTEQAVALQIAVNFLNSVLENDGKTVEGENSTLEILNGGYQNLADLIAQMNDGKVKTLIVHGVNPTYSLPAKSGFAEAVKKVSAIIYIGDADETGAQAQFNLPSHHAMENWADAEFQKGIFSIQQPTIRPLYETRAFQEMLMNWMKAAGKNVSAETWYDYLRNYWKSSILGADGFDDRWDEVLQKGFFSKADLEKSSGSRSFQTESFKKIAKVTGSAEMELVLYQKIALGDGRYANLSWLQELPDPVTKVVWDNYVNLSAKTAEKMQLLEGDVLQVDVGGTVLKLPTHIQPGVHDQVAAIAIGYGRKAAGQIANGVGANAFELVQFNGLQTVFSGQAVKLTKTSENIPIANSQGHHTMVNRPIVAETTFAEYQQNPEAGHFVQHTTGESIWNEHKYPGHKWGMSIDTNSCTGCSACVTACQSENNIPVVGKDYVLQGREMHWLRIDRYYSEAPGSIEPAENPETVHQPMPCQHCDNAPCETVCPVAATTHSDEGINEMTYNRCVGTRYCSNNCPYKVRRFNWFNYIVHPEPMRRAPLEMAFNPEVGVRSRGVMEKCTFCIHKIKEGKNLARDEGRPLKDGEIKTACQTACPADAIVFGDTNDPDSQVSRMIKEKRAYTVLEELNVKPAVRYLTKVRNRKAKAEPSEEGGHH